MDIFKIKITEEASRDMEKIYEYIADDLSSPEYALGQYNRIAKAIMSLEFFPERFSLFSEEPEHSKRIRKMVVDHYLVCYVVDPGIVTVIAVLYGASDVHFRLNER